MVFGIAYSTVQPHGYGFTWYVSLEFRSTPLCVSFFLSLSPTQRHTQQNKRHEAMIGHTRWTQTIACSRNQIAKYVLMYQWTKKKPRANERGGRRIKEKYRVMWLALYNHFHIYWQTYSAKNARKRRPLWTIDRQISACILSERVERALRVAYLLLLRTILLAMNVQLVMYHVKISWLFYFVFLDVKTSSNMTYSQKQPDPACYFISFFFLISNA